LTNKPGSKVNEAYKLYFPYRRNSPRNLYLKTFRPEIRSLFWMHDCYPGEFTRVEYQSCRTLYYNYIPYLTKNIWGCFRETLIWVEEMLYGILTIFHFLRGWKAKRLSLFPWTYVNLDTRYRRKNLKIGDSQSQI